MTNREHLLLGTSYEFIAKLQNKIIKTDYRGSQYLDEENKETLCKQ